MDPRVEPAADIGKTERPWLPSISISSPRKNSPSPAKSIRLTSPGVEGDFGVLAGHAPVVAAVRPGILTVTTGGTHQKFVVLGGLAEVSEKGLTVLADVATSVEELDRARFADTIAEMEAKLAEKEGSELDRAIERLDHFKSIQHELSATAMH
jgi:F-type H+-transporting ATPase subunit epsilon